MKNTILKIATKLNEGSITWALGGSLVLQHHDIVEVVHDIDILIAKADIVKAKAMLDQLGELKASTHKSIFQTTFFYEYIIDGIDVDILCEFKIENQGLYTYDFNALRITESEILDGIYIYYTSLEDWFVLYTLMGRLDKIDTLKRYFTNTGLFKKTLFELALETVPQDIKHDIQQWLKKI